MLTSLNLNAQNPEWLDSTLYPFKNKYIQLESGKMHYVDEGKGELILFVHGTPTWSFLYRDYIRELSKNHRCIAIDHIGFGLSDKPSEFEGSPQAHSNNLKEFIEKLKLENFTLVVHDFGGPIGLAYAVSHPENIKNIILFNTWLWETKNNLEVQKINRIINSSLGKLLYLHFNFSAKVLLKKGFYDQKLLTKTIHKHYTKPFPNKESRFGPLNLGKALYGSSDWYEEQWGKISKVQNKPILILWGMKDEFITPNYLQKWRRQFKNADVHELKCGHFVQEENTGQGIKLIRHFLK